ncbi:hypothetical protein Tco_0543384 [Tanacetum coccineum]
MAPGSHRRDRGRNCRNFLDKRPADCFKHNREQSKVRPLRSKAIIANSGDKCSSTSGVSPDVAELKDMVRALLLDKQTSPVPAPAPVKAVEQSCVTCGGAHSYRNCPATDSNNYRDNIQEYVSQAVARTFNQGNSGFPSATDGKTKSESLEPKPKPWEWLHQVMWLVMQNMQNQMSNITDLLTKIVNSNQASTSSSGSLPSNTVANPKGELKAITTRSGVSYDGPQIPPPVVEVETEIFKQQRQDLGINQTRLMKNWLGRPNFVVVDYDADPRVPLILGRPFLRTARALIDVHGEEMTLRHDDQSVTFKVDVLGFSEVLSNGNSLSTLKIGIIDTTFLTLTHSRVEDILLLEAILNSEPLSPLPNHANFPEVRKELKICEAKTDETSIDEPSKIELKDLPPHLEYAFLEGDNKLPVSLLKI